MINRAQRAGLGSVGKAFEWCFWGEDGAAAAVLRAFEAEDDVAYSRLQMGAVGTVASAQSDSTIEN